MNRNTLCDFAKDVADNAVSSILNGDRSEENVRFLYALIRYNAYKTNELKEEFENDKGEELPF